MEGAAVTWHQSAAIILLLAGLIVALFHIDEIRGRP